MCEREGAGCNLSVMQLHCATCTGGRREDNTFQFVSLVYLLEVHQRCDCDDVGAVLGVELILDGVAATPVDIGAEPFLGRAGRC